MADATEHVVLDAVQHGEDGDGVGRRPLQRGAIPHRGREVVDEPHVPRLGVGLGISATDYLQALRLRARLTREFIAEVFSRVDVLVVPVIPEPAPSYEANEVGGVEAKVARMGGFSRLTRPINGLGLPALSIPAGFTRGGLPVGMQLVGRSFDEAMLLRIGAAFQRATDFHDRVPQLP